MVELALLQTEVDVLVDVFVDVLDVPVFFILGLILVGTVLLKQGRSVRLTGVMSKYISAELPGRGNMKTMVAASGAGLAI
jgi:hypothetical protein